MALRFTTGERTARRLGTTLVMGASLALVITGCSKGTAVGQGIGNGINSTASAGANAFDAPTASAAPAATAFGAGAPTAAATTAAPAKTAVAAATKTAAAATKKAVATAAPTVTAKKTTAPKKSTAAVATAKASQSAASSAAPTATDALMPFAIGIYPDSGGAHTPLYPVNSSVYGGQSVVFTNYDTVAHSVQAQDGEFMSPSIPPNGTYTYVAETTSNETIDYQDATRPYDDGEIQVTQS